MKRILLTQDEFALVDDEDYDLLNQHKWYACKGENNIYAARNTLGKNRTTVKMHREILGLQNGDGKITDHIDHDGLNNQRNNLRVCTQQQNQMNARKRKNTSSIYKGVSFLKKDSKWQAYIRFDTKQIGLGLFDNEIEAAQAYDEAAIKYFGEFAKLNNGAK